MEGKLTSYGTNLTEHISLSATNIGDIFLREILYEKENQLISTN